MKSFAFSLLLLCICLSSRAQSPIGSIHPFDIRKYTVLDSANYRIDYKTTCLLDPKKHDKVTNEMYLLVGRKISKFGHVCVLDNQQELIAAESQEAGPGIEARGMGGMEVYKYLSGTKPYSELTFRLFIYSTDIPSSTLMSYTPSHGHSPMSARTYSAILARRRRHASEAVTIPLG